MSEDPKVELVNRFFSGTGPAYDSIVNLCTFGFDRSWKKKMLAKIPDGSVRILDQACSFPVPGLSGLSSGMNI